MKDQPRVYRGSTQAQAVSPTCEPPTPERAIPAATGRLYFALDQAGGALAELEQRLSPVLGVPEELVDEHDKPVALSVCKVEDDFATCANRVRALEKGLASLIRRLQLCALLTFVFCFAFGSEVNAADAKSTARFVDSITVAPVAALTHENLTGNGTLSAGLDLGVKVNSFVSIHGSALASEVGDWRGGVVDESEFYGRATFARFADETFTLYGKGGAVRDWGESLWGFGVGAGAELRFNKSVSLAADYTIRAWFKDREKDGQIRGLVNVSF